MKKYLIAILIMLMSVPVSHAQRKEPSAEVLKELQEFKIKYLIQEMELQADKQGEFSSIYAKYDKERNSLFRQLYHKARAIRKEAKHTDAEYLEAAESMATAKSREGALEESYFQQFRTILSPKQLYQMKRAEKKFDHKLNEMHRNNKGKKRGPKK